MELKIAVSELAKALQRVQGIVEKKTTMPILANVLLEAKADQLMVSATNLEIGLTGGYPAEVMKSGSITLAGKALFDIVKALPESFVRLTKSTNNWVEISCGKVNYRVMGMAAEGFPALPTFESVEFFGIGRPALKEMIDKTLYSVCVDETRYNLTGVFCEPMVEGPGLRMVSTDGHRLSVIEQPMESVPPMKKGLIIPRKGIVEMRRLLDDGADLARIGFVDNSAIFSKDGLTLTMQLVEGEFPDYKQVIPTSHTKKLFAPRAGLLAALRRTSLLSPDKAQGVRLDLSEGKVALSANNPDIGEAREEIDVRYDGEPLKIGFNFRYLADVLTAMNEEEVELRLTDALSPGVVVGVGCDTYRAIIMPMRL